MQQTNNVILLRELQDHFHDFLRCALLPLIPFDSLFNFQFTCEFLLTLFSFFLNVSSKHFTFVHAYSIKLIAFHCISISCVDAVLIIVSCSF